MELFLEFFRGERKAVTTATLEPIFLKGISRMDAKDFTVRLRQLREAAGYSQSDLGKRVGVSQAAIWHWETGDRDPSIEQLYKLAEALEVDVKELFSPPSAKPPAPRKTHPPSQENAPPTRRHGRRGK